MGATDQDDPALPHWPVRVKRAGDRKSLSRSASRALDVLEYFGQMRRPLRAVEIVTALDLHPSTANQLLKTMVDSAHLTFEARGKTYLPSPRLAQFAGWMTHLYGGDERLREMVRQLRAESGETITLSTPNDLFMQLIDLLVEGRAGESAERGMRVSMFGTAIGAAHLSTLPDAEIERLACRARIPEAHFPRILAEASTVRREGVASGLTEDGAIHSLAAPLPATMFTAPLVLGLAGPTDRIARDLGRLKKILSNQVSRWS